MNGPVTTAKAVYLPEPIWGRLATAADDRGVTVEDILASAVQSIIEPATVEERIIQLVRAGLPDRIIADRTGQFVARVGQIRRTAKLPPNRFRTHHRGAA